MWKREKNWKWGIDLPSRRREKLFNDWWKGHQTRKGKIEFINWDMNELVTITDNLRVIGTD